MRTRSSPPGIRTRVYLCSDRIALPRKAGRNPSSAFATLFRWIYRFKTGSDLGMSVRIIQVRPSRNPRWRKKGGWETYEAEGVSPLYCGPNAREDALSYARQRAGYAPTEIRVLDAEWNVVEAILPKPVRGFV